MSHSLNMKVIAEGVETAEQWNFLKNEKCDEIQGYYYSRPLPPDQLEDVLDSTIIHGRTKARGTSPTYLRTSMTC
jgi:EAL domain-containing protein (putative c-di-GMP-specific phosphodiesterase class I)